MQLYIPLIRAVFSFLRHATRIEITDTASGNLCYRVTDKRGAIIATIQLGGN